MFIFIPFCLIKPWKAHRISCLGLSLCNHSISWGILLRSKSHAPARAPATPMQDGDRVALLTLWTLPLWASLGFGQADCSKKSDFYTLPTGLQTALSNLFCFSFFGVLSCFVVSFPSIGCKAPHGMISCELRKQCCAEALQCPSVFHLLLP